MGNIIWLIFGGLESALVYFLIGCLLCITIIGIPFGVQCFKFASLMLTPFGKSVDSNFGSHPIANILWFIFIGLWSGILFTMIGVMYCITIIGIPFGLQWFKFAKLSLFPFGATL